MNNKTTNIRLIWLERMLVVNFFNFIVSSPQIIHSIAFFLTSDMGINRRSRRPRLSQLLSDLYQGIGFTVELCGDRVTQLMR